MGALATSVNIISAVYLLIIIIGVYHISVEESANTKVYKVCLWVCFSGLLIDTMAYNIYGLTHNDFILILLTYTAFAFFDVMMACYAFYLHTYIKEKNGEWSAQYLYYSLIPCALDIVVQTYGTVTGKLFTVKEGNLIYGPMAQYAYVIPTICLLICIIFLLRNVKYFSLTDVIIFSFYVILLVGTDLLWLFGIRFISGYVANAIALTIIFVMVQFRVISEANLQAEILNTLSERDALTGLKNRRGYDECLSAIPAEAAVCAVFCDVNSLKTVNDTLGHEAGDNLLKKMADILRKVFADDEIFRISGDEFVVIMRNVDEKKRTDKITKLKRIAKENDRIAAVGYETGEGRDILAVIRRAEKNMYSEKAAYYIETGRDRRRAH